jgi:single-stranded DNA-binding protein
MNRSTPQTINRVEVQGYVGRDAAQVSEKAPFKFSVATGNDNKPDGSGKYPLVFHNITAWPQQFPLAGEIHKGDFVRVIGRLNYTKWMDRKTGQERTGAEIVAFVITMNPGSEKAITPDPYKSTGGVATARAILRPAQNE